MEAGAGEVKNDCLGGIVQVHLKSDGHAPASAAVATAVREAAAADFLKIIYLNKKSTLGIFSLISKTAERAYFQNPCWVVS
jgi:hypothetical protein